MTTLTARARGKLKKSQFALPSTLSYPINDRAHAANAKARALQQFRAGKISKATYDKIVAAANKVLASK